MTLLTATGGGSSMIFIVILYVIVFGGLIYFMSIRPEKKRKAKKQAMLSGLAAGDSVLTTSGFYGVVIDIEDDTVIVEFGSNKNCRIPMTINAIAEIEKAEDATQAQ